MEKGRRLKKKTKKRLAFSFIIYIFLFAILIYSGIKICNWHKDTTNNNQIIETIKSNVIEEEPTESNEEEYKLDFAKLKEQNEDTVAWIKVNNTNIDYPIVKYKNNSFYLTHSFDKSKNSAGWIFADYKNKFDGTDKNLVIYGHNVKDGSMFGSMKNILTPEWYNNEENETITLTLENEEYTYKVFSIYTIEDEDYYIKTEFKTTKEFDQFIKKLKSRSIKKFTTEVTKEDSILTLSTCATNNKYRVVLHAKQINSADQN